MEKTIRLSDLGEGLNEAQLIEWHVNKNDVVAEGDLVASIETAKSIVEFPSPFSGKVTQLFSSIGELITVGAPLFNIQLNNTVSTLEQPLVGKEINESIEIPAETLINEINSTSIPTMALNMSEGKNTVPATIFDFLPVDNLPSQRILFEICHRVAKSLLKFPKLNGFYIPKTNEIKKNNSINMGIAMDTDHLGLFVPVITNPHLLSYDEFRNILDDLKTNRVKSKFFNADLTPTFTLSNIGSIGGLWGTPVLIPPSVGILAIGRQTIQPVWRNNAFEPQTAIPISFTFDHRCISGKTGCQFLNNLKNES